MRQIDVLFYRWQFLTWVKFPTITTVRIPIFLKFLTLMNLLLVELFYPYYFLFIIRTIISGVWVWNGIFSKLNYSIFIWVTIYKLWPNIICFIWISNGISDILGHPVWPYPNKLKSTDCRGIRDWLWAADDVGLHFPFWINYKGVYYQKKLYAKYAHSLKRTR